MVVHHKRAPYDVYIGRPSEWGNPFSHLPASAAEWRVATRDEAIRKYEEWLLAQPELVERVRRELRGKVLGCWRWCVRSYSNPGDLVVDPYAGSGSVGLACAAEGRSFRGWDSDPRFGSQPIETIPEEVDPFT